MNYLFRSMTNFPRNMLEENWSTNWINNDGSDKFSEIEYQNVFERVSVTFQKALMREILSIL